ncbi:MAG: cation transporter [Actinomycetota bacterium]|nr:cation transporter [Actinomycetota bacterium]
MTTVERAGLVGRGRALAWATIGWNAVEGVVGIVAGLVAGSVALVGFGVDSYVEVLAGGVIVWRLSRERHGAAVSAVAERRAVRIIAATFLLLAAGVGFESLRRLLLAERPSESLVGIVLAAVSLVVMPLLARAKRRVAAGLDSRALAADATETDLCAYLSAILLAGLVLNATLGWWWADPVAGLGIVWFAGREGVELLSAGRVDDCCA